MNKNQALHVETTGTRTGYVSRMACMFSKDSSIRAIVPARSGVKSVVVDRSLVSAGCRSSLTRESVLAQFNCKLDKLLRGSLQSNCKLTNCSEGTLR